MVSLTPTHYVHIAIVIVSALAAWFMLYWYRISSLKSLRNHQKLLRLVALILLSISYSVNMAFKLFLYTRKGDTTFDILMEEQGWMSHTAYSAGLFVASLTMHFGLFVVDLIVVHRYEHIMAVERNSWTYKALFAFRLYLGILLVGMAVTFLMGLFALSFLIASVSAVTSVPITLGLDVRMVRRVLSGKRQDSKDKRVCSCCDASVFYSILLSLKFVIVAFIIGSIGVMALVVPEEEMDSSSGILIVNVTEDSILAFSLFHVWIELEILNFLTKQLRRQGSVYTSKRKSKFSKRTKEVPVTQLSEVPSNIPSEQDMPDASVDFSGRSGHMLS